MRSGEADCDAGAPIFKVDLTNGKQDSYIALVSSKDSRIKILKNKTRSCGVGGHHFYKITEGARVAPHAHTHRSEQSPPCKEARRELAERSNDWKGLQPRLAR